MRAQNSSLLWKTSPVLGTHVYTHFTLLLSQSKVTLFGLASLQMEINSWTSPKELFTVRMFKI